MNLLFWNVENLFSPLTGGPRKDYTSLQGWTPDRFEGKLLRLAKVIKQISPDSAGLPLIGLCEVDTVQTAQSLAAHLGGHMRAAVETETESIPEYRDTALLYDQRIFRPEKIKWHSIMPQFEKGDILEARFSVVSDPHKPGESSFTGERELTVFVCHFKARTGEHNYTGTFRGFESFYLQQLIWKMHSGQEVLDNIRAHKAQIADNKAKSGNIEAKSGNIEAKSGNIEAKSGNIEETGSNEKACKFEFNGFDFNKNIIIMGDFNDDPFSDSLMKYLKASHDEAFVKEQKKSLSIFLYNLAFKALLNNPCGTNYYENNYVSPWSLLDQIIVSPAMLSGRAGLRINMDSFRIINEFTSNESGIPHRICGWDENDLQYWDDSGFSDHFPVAAEFEEV